MTDNNTGLIWQKYENASGYNWYQASGTYDATYNPTSQNICGSLNLGGYSDWRLPSKKELMSIVDYSIPLPGPTINTTYFPNTFAFYYWSSTTGAESPGYAWVVDFYDGAVYYGSKSSPEAVRCVRGGQLDFGNFQDNNNGTVTDSATGLMWQQGKPEDMAWWDSDLSYCEGLPLGGHSDWRLPNIKELESITDDTSFNPSIDTAFSPNPIPTYYWSSTTNASDPTHAWIVIFTYGSLNSPSKDLPNLSIRCVRGGQSGSFDDCTLNLSHPTKQFTSSGGEDTVTVSASSQDCQWTASESLDWVTITSGSSGTGSGSLSYTVSANSSQSNRTGNMTIAGQNFTINQDSVHSYALIVNKSGTGSGTVTSNPAGISCGNSCSASFTSNLQVILTAIPDSGSTFSSWSGCNTATETTCYVTMNANKTVTATFPLKPPQYALSLSKSGNGSVKVDDTVHALPWSGQFASGTNIQIEAVPDSGWSFTNWTGDYTGSANPVSINVSGNKNITANFSQNCDYSLTININPQGSGNVTKNPDKAKYCPNEQVTLTASPNSGYNFSSWSGVDSNSETTASITMNDNRTVTANFSQQISNEPDISVDPVTQEFGNIPVGDSSMPQTLTVSNTGSGDLVIGTLSITGNDASQFIKQNDTCSGQTVTPSANCTVNVIFSPTSTGSFDSILNIPSNDLDEPNVTVSLKGGSGADITGSWTSLVQQCKGTICKISGKINIQNIGNRDALSSLVKFYLSDDGIHDGGDSFLKEIKTGTLKVGKSKSMSLSYVLPAGISATDKYIIAVIDADNTVMEANESNNIIIYGPILRANLAGMWTSLTQQCKGEKCKIKGALNIQNIGYQDAASFVNFYLSDDSIYDAGDMFLKQVSIGILKIGKGKKKSLSYNLPNGITASGKYIIAVIDEDNSIAEENESDNNIAYGPIP
ncbi:MAG: DUF1566 domain-containing protein [Thermodesulfovibrionales bacterium]